MKLSSWIWGRLQAVLMIGLLALVTGCTGLQSNQDRVTGTVVFRERIALAPNSANLVVRLLDVSKADAPSMEIASVTHPATNPPMVFILPYDAKQIDPRHRYVIEAKIETKNGDLLFRNDQAYPVLTNDSPDDVAVLVKRAGPESAAAARNGGSSDVDRDVAAIKAQLPDLRVIPGSYSAGDSKTTFKAYVTTDGEPVYVEEHRDLGDYGSSDIKFYYRNGTLLRFTEDAKRINFGGSSDGETLNFTLNLDFAMGRFAGGSKTVDGTPGTPDEHEVSGAMAQSKVALSRIEAALGEAAMAPVTGRQTFVCEDKSRFYATFEGRKDEAVVEFLGREPLILNIKRTGSGYEYANEIYSIRGKGQEAIWTGPSGSTKCAVSAEITGLALAPGDFPVVDIEELEKPDNPEWTRLINELMPAINSCLAVSSGDLTSVLKAWPLNHGMVGVRTINNNGGRYDCLAPADGLGEVHTELVEANTNRLPGEGTVRFTPASGAYPGGECFSHQRLEHNGIFIGWLSRNNCTS
ncbi:putative lipoprotein YbaY/membrane-bound inhibitor of C-type lysozyme [Thalassospira sp. MBR-102]|uniref:YbaY family lipoprotein n=1 Tax=Thalassospira sp. MBR-102 TaxID=3156466 RepID=UPI0033959D68